MLTQHFTVFKHFYKHKIFSHQLSALLTPLILDLRDRTVKILTHNQTGQENTAEVCQSQHKNAEIFSDAASKGYLAFTQAINST